MTFVTGWPRQGSLTSVIGDLLSGVGIILCIPLVILAIGTPFALGLRFLLWITGML